MNVVVGIDLGSTTTKAVLLDDEGAVLGRGITNSRSNYEVACSVALEEARTSARFALLERDLRARTDGLGDFAQSWQEPLREAFRLELYLLQLSDLAVEVQRQERAPAFALHRAALAPAVRAILDGMERDAPALFTRGGRKSDFFRDLAGAAFVAGAEQVAAAGAVPFERLVGLFDRSILEVETRLALRDFSAVLRRAARRVLGPDVESPRGADLLAALAAVDDQSIEERAFVGTGYGRQTLPFPREAVRSEILCHGRGAHRLFPGTRTVLDIGGQDTKAIQVDDRGVVTGFQMNDRCAAGCGRYLGYIADELSLGLHELGPLAMKSCRTVKINSTCTVFAGAELRERLALGEKQEDILAGLHRAIMLRAMALLARSGGVRPEFTFTGGVCRNPMATRVLATLVRDCYGDGILLNTHPDSIYVGALGAALFALDDAEAGRSALLPEFVPPAQKGTELGA